MSERKILKDTLCQMQQKEQKSKMPIPDDYIIQSFLLFAAFRYALGRMTGTVSTAVKIIIECWPRLLPNDRFFYHKEIKEAIEANRAGMDIDVKQWQKILELPIE
jgi:hypothetical protein